MTNKEKAKPITVCSAPILGIFKEISFLQGSYDMARMLLLIQKCLKEDIEKFPIFFDFLTLGLYPVSFFLFQIVLTDLQTI